MAAALARHGGLRLAGGLVVGTHRRGDLPARVDWMAGGHPVPDDRSVAAGERALDLARRVPPDGVLLVLLSGGASALLALPRAGLSLQDKQATTRQLLLGGADIGALNTVRKHLSAIKGGQLATAAASPVLALAVSDVVGDDLSVIGSGPTVPDPTRFEDAWRVLEAHGGPARFPPAVCDVLRRGIAGREAETPKAADPRFARVVSRVIGSRADAVAGVARAAESLGYRVVVLPDPIVGEARTAGPAFVARAFEALPGPGPVCVVGAGETVVHVRGRGRGGRNQEFALASAGALAGRPGSAAVLSCGTDGIDGPTDAAGAIADSATLDRFARVGRGSAQEYLADNNAHEFFRLLGDLVVTGPTDTNVGDVQIFLGLA
jgi:hydroxypyruvate reductase